MRAPITPRSCSRKNLSLLYHIDSDWTSERLVPLFNPDHHFAEAVWNGLLNARYIPGTETICSA